MVDAGLAHAIINGLVVGSFVALGAIGLSLVYNIADVPNFAHGELLMLGAYLALLVNTPGGVPVLRFFTDDSGTPDAIGLSILFVLTFVAALGVVYLLGGRRAFAGSWWPIDVDPRLAVAVHVTVATLLGLYVATGVPDIFPGFVLSAVVLAAFAPLLDRYVFRRFREGDAALATMLIASMGLAFFLRYTTQAFFGGTPRQYNFASVRSFFGEEISITAFKFFDLFVGGAGLTFRIIDTGPAGDPTLVLREYSWPTVVGLALGVSLAAYGAYRWRRGGLREHEAAQTVGPKITGGLAGFVGLVVLAVLLGQPGSTPEDFLYGTRIRTSLLRLSVIVLAAVLMFLLHVVLKETKLGKAMRASADNLDLAKISGIDTTRVMMSTWIIAGAYAAVAGVTVGLLFFQIVPRMGFNILLPMFAAVILGGLVSVYGAIIGSYVVGISMEVGLYAFGFGPVHRVSMAFAVLLVILLVKPEGIVGGR